LKVDTLTLNIEANETGRNLDWEQRYFDLDPFGYPDWDRKYEGK